MWPIDSPRFLIEDAGGGQSPENGIADTEKRKTPLPYLPDDAERIRQMITTDGAKLVCPPCGKELTASLPIAGGGSIESVWEVHCASCGRSLVVSDVPEHKPPRSNSS